MKFLPPSLHELKFRAIGGVCIAQTPPRGHDISGDWWPQAELVDRSLLAYTPAPSNPSFMGTFVQ
jgi:hypothetical protein